VSCGTDDVTHCNDRHSAAAAAAASAAAAARRAVMLYLEHRPTEGQTVNKIARRTKRARAAAHTTAALQPNCTFPVSTFLGLYLVQTVL